MNQGDIKLAIDMLGGMVGTDALDDLAIAHCINTLESCGNEISKLQVERDAALNALRMEETISFRTQMQQYAAMCDRLGEALEQIAWLTVSGTKGNNLANAALAAWREMKGQP